MTANFYAGMIPFFPETPPEEPCPWVTYHPAASLAVTSGNVTGLDLTLDDRTTGGFGAIIDLISPSNFVHPCREQWCYINIDWGLAHSIAADMQSWGQSVIHDSSHYSASFDVNYILGPISFAYIVEYSISAVPVIGPTQFYSESWEITAQITNLTGGSYVLDDSVSASDTQLGSVFVAYPGYDFPTPLWTHQTDVPAGFPGTYTYTIDANYTSSESYVFSDTRDLTATTVQGTFLGNTADDTGSLWGAVGSLAGFTPNDLITSCGIWTGPGRVLGDLTL